ncbi:hypothetical protein [Sphingomonas immobilis]|uniref:Uncharacterized protein n=1 Tax=Sphingomonas immobilis TaxID=3063997 RepID=A0ABT9A2G8_9SPHN|nr:hypothetical protein [Sphingomonas sp. CA1-15]MDO7843186.1 hypothetical protein [Sphingomonas sp. CA1-15]
MNGRNAPDPFAPATPASRLVPGPSRQFRRRSILLAIPGSRFLKTASTVSRCGDCPTWAQLPGEGTTSGQRRIDYIASDVLPRLKR